MRELLLSGLPVHARNPGSSCINIVSRQCFSSAGVGAARGENTDYSFSVYPRFIVPWFFRNGALSRHIRPLPAHPGPEARWPLLPRHCGYDEILAEKPERCERTNHGNIEKKGRRERERERGREREGEKERGREGQNVAQTQDPREISENFLATTSWSDTSHQATPYILTFAWFLTETAAFGHVYLARPVSPTNGMHDHQETMKIV